MKKGFVPALGTPLNEKGELVKESFEKQINDQIESGASGLLCMGSMGIEAFIRAEVYPEVAKAAVEAAAGRVPVYVGAMDVSVARVKDRISALEDTDVEGFVFTAPFYSTASRNEAMNFFRGVAALTKHKILIYDLPVVSKMKITYDMVIELIRTVPNFAGIKSADLAMFRKLKLNPEVPENFVMVYSGLDTFDIAYKWGIDKCLDGMLSCTPKNTGKMFELMNAGDFDGAANCLDNILSLRDLFVANDIWPSFTYAMNLLGYEGCFHPDYESAVTESAKARVLEEMKRIGEI
jgi:4-hydroxy-tetrahydrodipicolinate synthase